MKRTKEVIIQEHEEVHKEYDKIAVGNRRLSKEQKQRKKVYIKQHGKLLEEMRLQDIDHVYIGYLDMIGRLKHKCQVYSYGDSNSVCKD